jgi:hypothetical protein
MISLPNPNYSVVEDTTDDSHIDQNDVNVTLTFAEHELMCDIMCQASTMMDFACPDMFDLLIDSELVQRYTMIENLRERFNTAWSDRFSTGMKFTDLKFEPHPNYKTSGVQAKYFFSNDYGVSVVRFPVLMVLLKDYMKSQFSKELKMTMNYVMILL